MGARLLVIGIAMLSATVAANAQSGGSAAPISAQQITPGKSTKADIQAAFGAPWRVVQFNDCGMPMDHQADETWEYRGTDPSGSFRLHVEFDDDGVVHLVSKVFEASRGQATVANVAPGSTRMGM
jgi:hypothetical protein